MINPGYNGIESGLFYALFGGILVLKSYFSDYGSEKVLRSNSFVDFKPEPIHIPKSWKKS